MILYPIRTIVLFILSLIILFLSLIVRLIFWDWSSGLKRPVDIYAHEPAKQEFSITIIMSHIFGYETIQANYKLFDFFFQGKS